MKKSLLSGLALCASIAPAFAADLPSKKEAPLPPAPVGYNWTGFYAGVNAGGIWGTSNFGWTANPPGFAATGPGLNGLGSNSISGSGFLGGVQAGYNYQVQNFVFGLESDIDYSGLRGSLSNSVVFPVALTAGTINESFHSDWLGTARGRLGFANGPFLIYATGGLAVANVSYSDFVFFNASSTFNSVSVSQTRAGWTIGGGAEWAFAPNWSVKAEYLYVDLGKTGSVSANSNPIAFPVSTIAHSHELTENIARLGVNYKFW